MGLPLKIRKHSDLVEVTLTNDAATTPEIGIDHYSSGEIHIPTGSTITGLTYYVAEKIGGTYLAAQDSSGSAVTQAVGAAKAYPLPASVMGASALRIKGDNGGTVQIVLKT